MTISAMAIFACSNDDDTFVAQADAPQPIRFDIAGVDSIQTTRTLIENYNDLRNACTPTVATRPEYLGEEIGIWGDCIAGDVTQKNIFPNASLYYNNKAGGNPNVDDDTNIGWNYPGEDLYWSAGGIYKFRAYYPRNEINDRIAETSDATEFIVGYYTTQMQCDMMVAYNKIDTKTYDLDQPVSLVMQHTLAALKFIFQFEEGLYETDKITSCWLQNDEKLDFASVAMFRYGTEENPTIMEWRESYSPESYEKIYYWEYSGGLTFERQSGSNTPAVAFTSDGTDNQTGKQYVNNDGWLIVIPQKLTAGVKLCFTTYEGGSTVYSGYIGNITFEPGKRYTYTVNISKTNMDMTLSIAPWNKYDSSFDIKF